MVAYTLPVDALAVSRAVFRTAAHLTGLAQPQRVANAAAAEAHAVAVAAGVAVKTWHFGTRAAVAHAFSINTFRGRPAKLGAGKQVAFLTAPPRKALAPILATYSMGPARRGGNGNDGRVVGGVIDIAVGVIHIAIGTARRYGTFDTKPARVAFTNIVVARSVLAKSRAAGTRAIIASPACGAGASGVLADTMSGAPLGARGNIACSASPSIEACAPGIEVAHTVLRTLRGTIPPGAVIPGIPFVAVAESELVTFSGA